MTGDRFWVGLDVGEVTIHVCILNDSDDGVLEHSCAANVEEITAYLRGIPDDKIVSIVMESGAAHNLVRQLKSNGFPVALLDAGKVSRFLSIRSKNDGNDARGLAEIARHGRHAHLSAYVRDAGCQRIRDQLIIRNQLIRQRTASRNALRSMLRNHGSAIRQITAGKHARSQVEIEIELIASVAGRETVSAIRSLLDLHEAQSRFIALADKRLARLSLAIPVVQQFRKIPGVGPICALSFYSTIANPDRFTNSASVAAYLGMVPRVKQSGTAMRRGRITKAGDAMTRGNLVLSAGVMISRAAGQSAIKDWGVELAKKKGYRRARVAVARKLATAMLCIWKSGEAFNPYPNQTPAGAVD